MSTDIEIAQKHTPRPITEIADSIEIDEQYLLPYGKDIARLRMIGEDSKICVRTC